MKRMERTVRGMRVEEEEEEEAKYQLLG